MVVQFVQPFFLSIFRFKEIINIMNKGQKTAFVLNVLISLLL